MTSSPEFDEIADELYGVRPDGFIEARDERVKRAKADGDKVLARDLAGLRRPTQGGWLINALWRDQQGLVEELIEMGEEFNAAMAAGDGGQLQTLTATRREIEGRLAEQAKALASAVEVTASPDLLREVQETLGAALVSAEAADQVRSGRLVRPLSYSGFGPGLLAGGTATAPTRPARKKPAASGRTITTGPDARSAARQAVAERELADAREALETAAAELTERTEAADRAEQEYASLSDRLAELRAEARELDQQVTAAKQAAARQHRRREQAEKAHDRARAAVARSEQNLA